MFEAKARDAELSSSGASRRCLQGFTSLCRGLRTGTLSSDELSLPALEDELGRFRVWAGNLGVLQKGHSSLEYRLQDALLVLEQILKLLTDLSNTLKWHS